MQLLVHRLAHLLELGRVVLLQTLQLLLERLARLPRGEPLLVLDAREVVVDGLAQTVHLAVLHGRGRAHLGAERLAERREAARELVAGFPLGAPRAHQEDGQQAGGRDRRD